MSITSITSDINTSLQDIQWAITLYSIVIAPLTIFGSKLGDVLGRKTAFITGTIIFGIGPLSTALSPNLANLICGWSL